MGVCQEPSENQAFLSQRVDSGKNRIRKWTGREQGRSDNMVEIRLNMDIISELPSDSRRG
jgi:hypothetical protein